MASGGSIAARRDAAIAWLKARGSQRNIEGMARYGIVARRPIGVTVGEIRTYAKTVGKDHDLAEALFSSGWYEGRHLAAFIGEPAKLTVSQMNRWARSFENWADCDAICFHLFDKSPLAWGRVRAWATKPHEFEKRAAFALIASMALHDKKGPDAPFLKALPLIKRGAKDERNFVKKAVSWALRGMAQRSPALYDPCLKLARTLAASTHPAERWVGKDVVRQVDTPAIRRRVEARAKKLAARRK